MTDDELSNLLQAWKRTPAPASLNARVFPARRPPAPTPTPSPTPFPTWWDRIPGSLTAVAGAVAGALVVWLLITWAPSRADQTVPEPAPVIEQAKPLVAVEQPVAKQLPTPNPLAAKLPKAKQPQPVAIPKPPAPANAPPRLINGPVPTFPTEFVPLLSKTTVKMSVRIGKDGRVIDISVIDGDPLLRSIAVEAVMGWLFEPPLENGEPTEAVTEIDVVLSPKKLPK